jgi:hypothetical protein
MRQRNAYGLAGTPNTRANIRPVTTGPRRPVTERGRMALESSRRRHQPRADD